MGQCPFCGQKVAENLIRLGGPCPHCFNQIPGDEAATDPGARLRAQEQAVEQSRRRKRQIINAVVAVVVLFAIGGAGYWYKEQRALQDQVLMLDLDDEFYRLTPEEFAAAYAVAETPPPDEVKTSGGSSGRNNGGRKSGGSSGSGSSSDGGAPELLATDAGPGNDGPTQTTMNPSGTGGPGAINMSGLGASVTRKGATLSDPDEISAMITATAKRYRGQLQTCYESRLKENPDLQGVWNLSFTVSTSGTTKNIEVKGQGIEDAALEQCIIRNVGAWSFSPITKEYPVGLPLKLRPR